MQRSGLRLPKDLTRVYTTGLMVQDMGLQQELQLLQHTAYYKLNPLDKPKNQPRY